MTAPAKNILEQAMELNEQDRLELAERLLDAWQPSNDPEYVAAWKAEISARLDEVTSGKAILIPRREAMEHIRRGEVDDE